MRYYLVNTLPANRRIKMLIGRAWTLALLPLETLCFISNSWFSSLLSHYSYGGTATAGFHGTATVGDRGTATAGFRGTATAGAYGTATAGDCGVATVGN
ncbi:MAG TPA: hypothetical protein PLL95_07450 [Anaerolineales bacterium]|nr:hypothetical protein [Anaerolineales bacterium]